MTTSDVPLAPARGALVPALLRLAAPVALSRLGFMAMGIVDTVMVGQIAPHELAYLALGWAPTGVVLVTGLGLLTGVQVLGARAVGEGNPHGAGAVWRKGMIVGALAGILFTIPLFVFADSELRIFGINKDLTEGAASVTRLLSLSLTFQFTHLACSSFLEAIKRPLAGTIVVWAANALNLLLNIYFVPRYGADGAAISTIIGRGFMLAALLAWIFVSKEARAHGALAPGIGTSYRALFAVGGASAVSQMAEAGAFNIMSVIAGRIGADAVAAYQILLNVLAVVFMIAMGFSAATSVLVSEAYGAHNRTRVNRAGWYGLGLNSAGMAIAAMLCLIFAAPIAHGFTHDPGITTLVIALMPLCAVIFFPDGGQVVMAQALRGRGDNWFPTASHIAAYVIAQPVLAFWLAENLGGGVAGVMQAITLASLLSASILCARFWYLSRQTP